MKILLAEDDTILALVLRKALEKLGHDVSVAADGEEAWRLLRRGDDASPGGASAENGFRLLITDWMMPKTDGLELCRQIRSREAAAASAGARRSYLYVVLLTAKSAPEDRLRALSAGADDFLVKPLDTADLVARLEVARRVLALQEEAHGRSSDMEKLHRRMEPEATPLGEMLVMQKVLTPDQLQQALDQQRRTGQRLGAILIANGWVTDEDITQVRGQQTGTPYVNLAEATPDPEAVALVPREIALRHHILPLSFHGGGAGEAMGRLRVALADPWNIEGIDLVQRETRRRIEPLLASHGALTEALQRAYGGGDAERSADVALDDLTDAMEQQQGGPELSVVRDEGPGAEEEVDIASALKQSDEAPIIRLINGLLIDAVRRRASDIHLEPYKKDFEIRYRIDGRMHVVRTLGRPFLSATTSRIKIMADLDISERRLPQDGRIALRIDGRGVDLRVSTLPTQFGERVVMRVLDRASASYTLDQLDFSGANEAAFERLVRRPHGIVLVTGPTGSGKTTTLYATLNALKSPTTNIMTCEDPIEFEMDRISQSNVNPKAGLTFASQLRAILRQDPDVILVGEIRDQETAEIAFRAAMTGHLVLSTLHCNEAAGAPTRLLDMGVAPFLIASSVVGVVAQRLVPRLCPECREEAQAVEEDAARVRLVGGQPVSGETFWSAPGCAACHDTGIRGRIGIHEVLTVDERIQALTMRQADTSAIREIALDNGMIPMTSDGLAKARRGLCPLDEVVRKVSAFGTGPQPPARTLPVALAA